MRSQLTNEEAKLLADDTVNIFAVARYLRQVANEGEKKSDAEMAESRAEYPGLKMSDYAKNSSEWSAGNIAAIGSEYTSNQWDNRLEAEWGHYVYECYKDVKASGVFR